MRMWLWNPIQTPSGLYFGVVFGTLGPNFAILGASWDHLGPLFGVIWWRAFFNIILMFFDILKFGVGGMGTHPLAAR